MIRDKSFLIELVMDAADAIAKIGDNFIVKEKSGRGNFVTDSDYASEKVIIEKIKNHFPDDYILSEETSSKTENALERDNIWIIDPIDGTNNFRFKRNYSAISIAYAKRGVLEEGVVYNFSTNEIYQATKGKGSYYNRTPIKIPKITSIENITVGIGNSSNSIVTKRHLNILANINPVPWVSVRGSSALEISEIARGSLNAYIHSSLHPWDVAAAMLIVRESGGTIKKFCWRRS